MGDLALVDQLISSMSNTCGHNGRLEPSAEVHGGVVKQFRKRTDPDRQGAEEPYLNVG